MIKRYIKIVRTGVVVAVDGNATYSFLYEGLKGMTNTSMFFESYEFKEGDSEHSMFLLKHNIEPPIAKEIK
jgi:hypothetical protein